MPPWWVWWLRRNRAVQEAVAAHVVPGADASCCSFLCCLPQHPCHQIGVLLTHGQHEAWHRRFHVLQVSRLNRTRRDKIPRHTELYVTGRAVAAAPLNRWRATCRHRVRLAHMAVLSAQVIFGCGVHHRPRANHPPPLAHPAAPGRRTVLSLAVDETTAVLLRARRRTAFERGTAADE